MMLKLKILGLLLRPHPFILHEEFELRAFCYHDLLCLEYKRTCHQFCLHTFIYYVFCIIWEPEQLSRYSDSLGIGRFEDRVPVEARYSVPSGQTPRPNHPPVQLVLGLSRGQKAESDADHPPPPPSSVGLQSGLTLPLRLPSICTDMTFFTYSVLTRCVLGK